MCVNSRSLRLLEVGEVGNFGRPVVCGTGAGYGHFCVISQITELYSFFRVCSISDLESYVYHELCMQKLALQISFEHVVRILMLLESRLNDFCSEEI